MLVINNFVESRVRKVLWHIAEVVKVIRLLRGPLIASIAAAAMFYLPDQIRELYRIAAADRNFLEISIGVGALTTMFWICWWVSFEIVQRLGDQVDRTAAPARLLLAVLPPLIGALPLLGCAGGFMAAVPGKSPQMDITNPLYELSVNLTKAIGGMLQNAFFALIGLAVLLLAAALWLQKNRWLKSEATVRRHGVFGLFGLLASATIIVGTTAAVCFSPVALPGAIGTLPLMALFFVALVLVLGQMTFWSEKTGVPFLTLLALIAIGVAALDLNDNHRIAAVDENRAAPSSVKSNAPSGAWGSFVAWYEARPGKQQYPETFPVYVVAAQGGGIYAAYHTAILLSRMEDYCPEFRNHLFAVSSVSGGSLGAAVFASVTKVLAQTSVKQRHQATAARASNNLSCPSMEQGALRSFSAPQLDIHERAARSILASNFLAPLAAGALFPDFLQRFLFFPEPKFDRARWLEAAFEESWHAAEESWQPPADNPFDGENPFKRENPLGESVLNLWSPQGAAPALLINTTEVDSGRRLVISPFKIEERRRPFREVGEGPVPIKRVEISGQKTITSLLQIESGAEVLQFPLWNQNLLNPALECHGLDISLSTAVSLSARFPWLTPAGSLETDCTEDGKLAKSRLVDGGYVDNSGVDTALDVITQIERKLAETDYRLGSIVEGSPPPPKIEIHLIVLSTSEFPERGGYGFADELEPIRALLSTREARTPIAITRARRQLGVGNEIPRDQHCLPAWENTAYHSRLGWIGCAAGAVDRVHEARFQAPFYAMPLGWRLSKVSRDVIDAQSGRFWDCDPGLTYAQQDAREFSNADCVQLLIYHQLNGTLGEAIKIVELGDDWRQLHREDPQAPARLQHDKLLGCYSNQLQKTNASQITTSLSQEDQSQSGSQEALRRQEPRSHSIEGVLRSTLQRRQESSIEQVLRSWDRSRCSEAWLAYILTVMQYESNMIPYRASGCLTDKCAWRLVDRAMNMPGHSSTDGSRFSETNKRQPNGNSYYKRGIVALNGPTDYQNVSRLTDDPVYDIPDLLLVPEVSARAAFAWMQQLFPPAACTSASEEDFNVENALRYYFRKRGHGIRPEESIDKMLDSNQQFMGCIAVAKVR